MARACAGVPSVSVPGVHAGQTDGCSTDDLRSSVEHSSASLSGLLANCIGETQQLVQRGQPNGGIMREHHKITMLLITGSRDALYTKTL